MWQGTPWHYMTIFWDLKSSWISWKLFEIGTVWSFLQTIFLINSNNVCLKILFRLSLTLYGWNINILAVWVGLPSLIWLTIRSKHFDGPRVGLCLQQKSTSLLNNRLINMPSCLEIKKIKDHSVFLFIVNYVGSETCGSFLIFTNWSQSQRDLQVTLLVLRASWTLQLMANSHEVTEIWVNPSKRFRFLFGLSLCILDTTLSDYAITHTHNYKIVINKKFRQCVFRVLATDPQTRPTKG